MIKSFIQSVPEVVAEPAVLQVPPVFKPHPLLSFVLDQLPPTQPTQQTEFVVDAEVAESIPLPTVARHCAQIIPA